MTPLPGSMKRPRAMALLMAACVALCMHSTQAIAPILVRGNKMYNEQTKERFFIKGITYEYVVSDTYYDKYSKAVIKANLADLEFNTLRLYNANPDESYADFMNDMAELGIYVLISASPANSDYFGDYRYSTITKTLGPTGKTTTSSNGVKTTDLTNTCYPALLLNFGKKIVKNFAQYNNTLGIVVANEIMQADLTAAACVKQYVIDLKNWMKVNGKKIRLIPLAYAAADSSYGSIISNADSYHVLKVQGLLCGDKMTDGNMVKSIDIYLINEYRWCPDNTFAESYQRFLAMAEGIPIVLAFGEYGCKTSSAKTRDWGMVPYFYQEPSKTNLFSEVWSGGLAYSYGEAMLGTDSLFPMFTGGSTDMLGQPSTTKTTDFTNLKTMFAKYTPYSDLAEWTDDTKCTWYPDVQTNTTVSNSRATADGWIISSCSSSDLKVITNDTWTTVTREGVVCTDTGAACDVTISTAVGTTEQDICGGTYTVTSGGNSCNSSSDCGDNGQCITTNGVKSCSCLSCYTGSDCSVKDITTCNTLSSSSSAPGVIFAGVGAFIGVMVLVFAALAIVAAKKKKAMDQLRSEVAVRAPMNEEATASAGATL